MSEAGAPTDETGLVHQLLDRLAIIYSDGAHRDDAANARAEYFAATGELHDEDRDIFDARMAAYLEWYIVERPLPGVGISPLTHYLTDPHQSLTGDERQVLTRLSRGRRSLFVIVKVQAGLVVIEDLANKERLTARERRGTAGFSVKDLCEARVCPSGDVNGGWMFTKTLLFHPRDVSKTILAAVKQAQKDGEALGDLAFRLARLQQRWHRLGHVTADRIYRDGLARKPAR